MPWVKSNLACVALVVAIPTQTARAQGDLLGTDEMAVVDPELRVRGVNGLTVHGTAEGKGAVLSFSVEGAHPHDLAQILAADDIAIV